MPDRCQCLPWCLFLLPWYSCLKHDEQFGKDEASLWQYLFEAGGCESAAWEPQMVVIEVIRNEVTWMVWDVVLMHSHYIAIVLVVGGMDP